MKAVLRPATRDDIVLIGGRSLLADEWVQGCVVIGGSANVDGQIDGELVVVGGSASLGPQADVRRDVTVVGGALSRDPKALIRGKVQEVGVGEMFGRNWGRRDEWTRWNPMGAFYPVARSWYARACWPADAARRLVILVSRGTVEQIADRPPRAASHGDRIPLKLFVRFWVPVVVLRSRLSHSSAARAIAIVAAMVVSSLDLPGGVHIDAF